MLQAGQGEDFALKAFGPQLLAQREHFPGSPTIRLDGEDAIAAPESEPFSLTCRVYRLRDGRISATPDPEDLRDAVRRIR